jgi:hypothetical protein
MPTILLLVVLYGCATWSLTLREEHGLWVLETRFFREKFGPNMEDITEKLHDMYSSYIAGMIK